MMTELQAKLNQRGRDSKKFVFAVFASVLLFLLSLASLIAILEDDRNGWPGTIGVISVIGLVCIAIGYVLGQAALDRTLAKAVEAVQAVERGRNGPPDNTAP